MIFVEAVILFKKNIFHKKMTLILQSGSFFVMF